MLARNLLFNLFSVCEFANVSQDIFRLYNISTCMYSIWSSDIRKSLSFCHGYQRLLCRPDFCVSRDCQVGLNIFWVVDLTPNFSNICYSFVRYWFFISRLRPVIIQMWDFFVITLYLEQSLDEIDYES